MKIFVLMELKDRRPRKAALQTLGLARRAASERRQPLHAVVLGPGAAQAAGEIVAAGADEVLVCEDASLDPYRVEPFAGVLDSLLAGQSSFALYLANSAVGRDLAPRLAQRLGAAMVHDVTACEEGPGDKVRVARPIHGGKATEIVDLLRPSVIVTVRANAFPTPQADPTRRGAIRQVDCALENATFRAAVIEVVQRAAGEVDLTEADIVVAGGMGLGGAEGFDLLRSLCQAMGAALGASRGAVHEGWIGHERQVGQTGKTVGPALYIACGISGSVQHQAGMSSSKCIVAINRDPAAPIFGIADYGIVADLYEAVPALIDEFAKGK